MAKKHYICTHTWSNTDTIKDVLAQQSEMTVREFFAGLKSDKAETLQHWMGKDDFFFCHWHAIDEQSIIDRLASNGGDKFFITMATLIDPPKINVDRMQTYLQKLK